MNHPTSWDPSLVKKFSSSNHFKLLNQLRNEVKKYPLNNKKKATQTQSKNISYDNKNKIKVEQKQNAGISSDSNKNNDVNSNKSNVSFNNSKNFSIYNQTDNSNNSRQTESLLPGLSKSNQDTSSPSFKDRLNQIDMK